MGIDKEAKVVDLINNLRNQRDEAREDEKKWKDIAEKLLHDNEYLSLEIDWIIHMTNDSQFTQIVRERRKKTMSSFATTEEDVERIIKESDNYLEWF